MKNRNNEIITYRAKKFFYPDMDILIQLGANSRQEFPGSKYSGPRVRDYWNISLLLKGSADMKLNGAKTRYMPGMVFLLRPEDVFSQKLPARIDLLQVLFHRKFLDPLGLDFGEKEFLAGILSENYTADTEDFPIGQRVFPSTPEIRHLMKRMLWEFEHQYRETELMLRLNLASLLLLLNVQSKRSIRQGSRAKVKEKIEHFLSENIRQGPDWNVLAKELRISPSYLLKSFKRIAGCTPGQAVRKVRLREAARLLRETELPLPEIQCRSGMTSFSMFYRLFTQEYGISPGRYRERMSGIAEWVRRDHLRTFSADIP